MSSRGLFRASFVFWGAIASVSAGERLDAEALRTLLVGSTEVGQYSEGEAKIPYVEFFRADGIIKGKDVYSRYSGKYAVKDDGCLYVDYEGTDSDGCYYFEHVSGNRYRAYGPDAEVVPVTILVGDPKSLDEY